MNKTLLASLIIMVSLTTANASEAKAELFLIGGQNKVSTTSYDNGSKTNGGIGYGITKYWDNGVLLGGSLYGAAGSNSNVYAGIDIRLGYSYENTGIYAIGSGIEQSLGGRNVNGDGSITAYGFGVGGGIEYKWEKFAIAAEYKTYSMSPVTLPDYTLQTENILLKYRF